ncbi:MAG: hypothetical protein IIW08_07660, partial [Clostridia bacterium]|nr:hypothetical protein [Clostridia bacterium]
MKKYTGRYITLAAILLVFFLAMVVRLYQMQIVNHDKYINEAEKRSTKTISHIGMRGTIYDKNMVPLAYDEKSYDVQFYRDPSRTSDTARAEYTNSIYKTILMIEANGKQTLDPD